MVTVLCLGVGAALATGEGFFPLDIVSWVSSFSISDAGSSVVTLSADRCGEALFCGFCTGEHTLCFRWGDPGTGLTSTLVDSICGAPWPADPRLRGATGTGSTLSGRSSGMTLGSTLGGGTALPTETGGKGGGGTADQNGGCRSPAPHPKGP